MAACGLPWCQLCAPKSPPPPPPRRVNPLEELATMFLSELTGLAAEEIKRRGDETVKLTREISATAIRKESAEMFDARLSDLRNVVRIYAQPVRKDETVSSPVKGGAA